MTKDYDDDDLEELEDDDLDGGEDRSDSDDSDDYDDDFDDLEELVDEDDGNGEVAASTVPVSTKEEAEELAEEKVAVEVEEEEEKAGFKEAPRAAKWGKDEDDEDSSFFDEAADEGDDLGIAVKEPAPQVVRPVAASTPPIVAAPPKIAGAARPAEKGIKPLFLILPAIGILLGVGIFFFKGEKSKNTLPGIEPPKLEKTAPPAPAMASFIKPKIDDSIPDHYEELKRTDVSDPLKIAALMDRGLLKKKAEDSSMEVEKLTLVLYKTDVRYVVSQTYYYTDGGKWTVETQFSDLDSEPEEVTKAFDSVYP